MSEDIRKMIDKVKNFNQFINENTDTDYYMLGGVKYSWVKNEIKNVSFGSSLAICVASLFLCFIIIFPPKTNITATNVNAIAPPCEDLILKSAITKNPKPKIIKIMLSTILRCELILIS